MLLELKNKEHKRTVQPFLVKYARLAAVFKDKEKGKEEAPVMF